jgi:Raf kinase inhibitor-like YbhB/YbcL family protein
MYTFFKRLMVSNISKFNLSSSAFHHSEFMPKKYTPEGEDINPPLKWENPPKGTRSFALIVDDPDAPHGIFTHWLLKDIPLEANSIEENKFQGTEVTNSWKMKKWKGPLPPTGTHRYFFKLYALNTDHLKADNLSEFYKQVEQHKLGEAILMGKYSAKH